jgi:hypothetical protein
MLMYSISFFAGAIAESALAHVSSAILLCVAPIAAVFLAGELCSRLSFGFSGFETRAASFLVLPVLLPLVIGIPSTVELLGSEMFASFIFAAATVSASLFALSSLLCALKPAWKASGLPKLALAETAFCTLAALASASILPFSYAGDKYSPKLPTPALLAGAPLLYLAGFMLARMAARKTVRVWNRETFARLGLSAAAAALAFAALVAGMERRAPEAAYVKSAKVDFGFNFPYGIATKSEFVFSDPENLEEIIGYCNLVMDSKDELKKLEHSLSDKPLKLEIELSSGKVIKWTWLLPNSYYYSCARRWSGFGP